MDDKIPNQYKKQAEKLIHDIGCLADKLYPIMTELAEEAEIQGEKCIIIIKCKKKHLAEIKAKQESKRRPNDR